MRVESVSVPTAFDEEAVAAAVLRSRQRLQLLLTPEAIERLVAAEVEALRLMVEGDA